jgi:DNA-binding cell septation regulator SpoVG
MIDRNESLRDQIATIVQAGYSQRKTSVETADEIISKISFLSILTRLERENAKMRRDKALLDWLERPQQITHYVNPFRDVVHRINSGQTLREAIDAAMGETK